MKFILKFISKAWEVVAAFNLFSRKKREENLLFCPSSLKKKKSRRINSIVLASLTRKWITGMEKKILHFYKLSVFSPQSLIFFKGYLLCPPLKTTLLAMHFKDKFPVTAGSPSKYRGTGLEETPRHQPIHCPAPRQSQSSLPWMLVWSFSKTLQRWRLTFSSFDLSKALPILLPERFFLTSHPQFSSSSFSQCLFVLSDMGKIIPVSFPKVFL